MRRTAFTLASSLAAALVLACVTINVYFPEAAVKDLSEKIEDAVAREAAESIDSDKPEAEDLEAEAILWALLKTGQRFGAVVSSYSQRVY